MTSSRKIWHVHWCGLLLGPNHDQLSSIYLFKHCLLFVAVEIIYRVCHILWLLIISLILFYVKKIAARNWSFPDASIHPSWFGAAKPLGSISAILPHICPPSFLFSPFITLLHFPPLPIPFHFGYFPVTLGTHKAALDDDQGDTAGGRWAVAFSAVWPPSVCLSLSRTPLSPRQTERSFVSSNRPTVCLAPCKFRMWLSF